MSNKGLGSTSLFLLYSIAGHNNTAIKITNTYSDDQLVIYIFKRQTQQKQWMWAMISFNGDRFNPHGIPFPALPQSELDWRTLSPPQRGLFGSREAG